MKWYLLVNTFAAINGQSIGTVISRHKSLESAAKYEKRTGIRKLSVPTACVKVTKKIAIAQQVCEGDYEPLNEREHEAWVYRDAWL